MNTHLYTHKLPHKLHDTKQTKRPVWDADDDDDDDDIDDDAETSHPEQPVGEDEGVDGVACLAVPHLQNIFSHLLYWTKMENKSAAENCL